MCSGKGCSLQDTYSGRNQTGGEYRIIFGFRELTSIRRLASEGTNQVSSMVQKSPCPRPGLLVSFSNLESWKLSQFFSIYRWQQRQAITKLNQRSLQATKTSSQVDVIFRRGDEVQQWSYGNDYLSQSFPQIQVLDACWYILFGRFVFVKMWFLVACVFFFWGGVVGVSFFPAVFAVAIKSSCRTCYIDVATRRWSIGRWDRLCCQVLKVFLEIGTHDPS